MDQAEDTGTLTSSFKRCHFLDLWPDLSGQQMTQDHKCWYHRAPPSRYEEYGSPYREVLA